MNITYDPDVDIAYIKLINSNSSEYLITEAVEADELISNETIFFDFNKERKIIGIEIHQASKTLPKEFLDSVNEK